MKLNKPEENIEEHSDFSDRLEEEYFGRWVGLITLNEQADF
jgi:hypothetical protein